MKANYFAGKTEQELMVWADIFSSRDGREYQEDMGYTEQEWEQIVADWDDFEE